MKYIIVSACGRETAIVFPEHVTHSQAINKLQAIPLSAGYCELVRDNPSDMLPRVRTHGDSTSLKLKPRPGDTWHIAFSLWTMGLLSADALLANKPDQSNPPNPSDSVPSVTSCSKDQYEPQL